MIDYDIAALIGIFIAVVFILTRKPYRSSSVLQAFGLNESDYVVVSTDLGKTKPSVFFSYKGVNGICDGIFKNKKKKSYIAGEFKGRKYKGKVRLYEYYQVILYTGLTKARFRSDCIGRLAYSCGSTVDIEFNRQVFDALMHLRSECVKAKSSKPFFKPKPLHKRHSLNIPRFVS